MSASWAFGEVKAGKTPLSLSFELGPVNLDASAKVWFSYTIVNKGYDASSVGHIKNVINKISQAAGKKLDEELAFDSPVGDIMNYGQ